MSCSCVDVLAAAGWTVSMILMMMCMPACHPCLDHKQHVWLQRKLVVSQPVSSGC